MRNGQFKFDLFQVVLENLFALSHSGKVDVDVSVKATSSQQCLKNPILAYTQLIS